MMAQPEEHEWTYVPAKRGRKAGRNVQGPASSASQLDKDATNESLLAAFDIQKTRWLESNIRSGLFELFKHLYLLERPPITKAVCLGIGNFAISNLELRGRSMLQLAVFLDIAKHLEDQYGSKLELFAQEPRFIDQDRDFLTVLKITTLDFTSTHRVADGDKKLGPAAAYMEESAFVADFFVEVPVAKHLADYRIGLIVNAMPAAIEQGVPTHLFEERYKKKWQNHYRWFKFPGTSKEEQGLHGLYVCTLREEEENEK